MKKLNRTYIMGIVFIILALWVLFQTTQIPEKTGFQRAGTKAVPVHFRDRHDRHGSSVHDLRW
ncbi:MAG: hypothetical protein ACLUD2_08655 [Clostridium sp.]